MLSELVTMLLMVLMVGLVCACRVRTWYYMFRLPTPNERFVEEQQCDLHDAWVIRTWLVGGAGLAMIVAAEKLRNYYDYPLIDIDETFVIHAMNNWVWLIPIMVVILFFSSFVILMRFGAPFVGWDLVRREKYLRFDIKITLWDLFLTSDGKILIKNLLALLHHKLKKIKKYR